METTSEKNKRIANNTLLLYLRMLVAMAVALYTSRLILQALGVVDFGIYNVVGGLVSLCSVFSSSISTAISRFLTIELGRDHQEQLKQVFSASVSILFVLCILIFLVAEPIGLWFISNKIVIPVERLSAAYWIFHFSLLTFFVNLLGVPFTASIISHERMGTFAYISIFDVFIRLMIVLVLFVIRYDRLVVYGLLMALSAAFTQLIYVQYCLRHFSECRFHIVNDRLLFKEIFSLAGWNVIGSTAAVIRDQGGNILMNMFGGPIVNAARGISLQVNGAVSQFVNNFMTALNPQIIKSYATSDIIYLYSLLFRGSRFSYYLLLILSLPLLICTKYVLGLWLGIVPDYSVLFVRLALLVSMVDALTNTLTIGILATGKVKYYQIIVGGMLLLNLPISYLFLRSGMTPDIVMWVSLMISIICMFLRILFVQCLLGIEVIAYFREVCLNCLWITIASLILPMLILLQLECESFSSFLIIYFACVLSSCVSVFFLGCNRGEREMIVGKVKSISGRLRGRNH